MIISATDLKKYVETTVDVAVLEDMLQALETMVRKRTNNTFVLPNFRFRCQILAQKAFIRHENIPGLLNVGDTVQITQSVYNDGLYVIKSIDEDGMIELDKPLIDESEILLSKVQYPMDVKMGVVSLMKWELENRDKVGIQSETISRHSVTYFNMDGDNSTMGYPKSLMGFLKPYMKARF